MCTVLLPPGDNPIAVNKHIIKYVLHEDTDVIPLQNLTKWKRDSFFLYLGDADLLLAVIPTTIWPTKMGPFEIPLNDTGILRNVNRLGSEKNFFLKGRV